MNTELLGAVVDAAERQGDRDALEAHRLGMSYDHHLTLEQQCNMLERAIYAHDGSDLWTNYPMSESQQLLKAYEDAYRSAYRDGWPETDEDAA